MTVQVGKEDDEQASIILQVLYHVLRENLTHAHTMSGSVFGRILILTERPQHVDELFHVARSPPFDIGFGNAEFLFLHLFDLLPANVMFVRIRTEQRHVREQHHLVPLVSASLSPSDDRHHHRPLNRIQVLTLSEQPLFERHIGVERHVRVV